ncbi:MAG: dipeptide epimerase [Rhodanobacteraceae bacterium]
MSSSRLKLSAVVERRPMKAPFHITGYTFTEFDALVVSVREDSKIGRGEAQGVYYHQETPESMLAQVEGMRADIERGLSRTELLRRLPPGGARNALDCALWDLEAKRSGQPVWKLVDLEPPRPLVTTWTIGADAPSVMAHRAREFADAQALKLKLVDDDANAARVRAVRAARPDVWLMVDANQGLTRESFARLLPTLVEARVQLVEQPFAVGREDWMDGLDSPIRIGADESVQDRNDLQKVVDRADIINIKLDKSGGLTEALAMAQQAREMGFELMVGNMGGSSLAMAPGFVLGQSCQVIDLDGPLSLRHDYAPAARYDHGTIWCPEPLWGNPGSDAA